MMKCKARTETRNLGVLELGELTLNEDYMQLFIDICDMSDELKAEINKAVEIEKVRYSEEIINDLNNGISRHPSKCNTVWSDKPVIKDFTYLEIILQAGKPIEYRIEFGFHDADDKYMEAWDGSIAVDLSGYECELKLAIINALVSKFF